MNDPKGHVCPECGTPRRADNTPSCACAARAADAHIENRTAETAAAEDFDPLRIRPYVELTPETPGSPTSPTPLSSSPSSPSSLSLPEHLAFDPAAGATMPIPAVRQPGWPDEAATAVIPAVPQSSDSAPALFAEDESPSASGGRPRVLLLGAAGAVVAILAAGGLAGGMFMYDKPARDDTVAQEVRESVPAAATSAASPTPSASPAPPKSAPPPPAPALPPAPARSASPSPSPTLSASPTPSGSASPTQAPPTAQATGTITPAPSGAAKESAPVLRPGDQGDEVLELQLRLSQLFLYFDDADGVYDNSVENAVNTYQRTRDIEAPEPGVYDRTTRERLESETTQP